LAINALRKLDELVDNLRNAVGRNFEDQVAFCRDSAIPQPAGIVFAKL
jgi:hypothetical protein